MQIEDESSSAPWDTTSIGKESPARAEKSLGRWFRNNLIVRRTEFLPVAIGHLTFACLVAGHSFRDLWSLDLAMGVVAVILSVHVGNMSNSVADRELDATFKSRVSQAVYGLGVVAVTAQIALSALASAGLLLAVMLRTGHWDVGVMVFVGGILGLEYSLPPLRLKGSGLWQLPVLQITAIFVPDYVVVRSIPGAASPVVLLAITGMSLSIIALFVTSHAADYPEDAAFNLRTYVIALGIRRTALAAVILYAIGAALTAAAFWSRDTWWLIAVYLFLCIPPMRFLLTLATEITENSQEDGIALLRRQMMVGPRFAILHGFSTALIAFIALLLR